MTVTGSEAAQVWSRSHIPHYELTAETLPRPKAPWDELVHFAGAFDGAIIAPGAPGVREVAAAWRRKWIADGSLPEGLTRLRAVLHGERRLDYWSSQDEPIGRDALRHCHALVESIRTLVASRSHIKPDPTTQGGVEDKVLNAFDRLVGGYAEWGGYRYHGWQSYEDPRTFHGPVIWSERDCDVRFAWELEREWPRAVHMEFAIGKSSRLDYVKAEEGVQRVDVVVSDLASFVEGDDSFDRFRTLKHEAFFEVKWFVKGWSEKSRDARTRLNAIPFDLGKLERHLRRARCRVAGMLVIDDAGVFNDHGDEYVRAWPKGVWRLYVGPYALKQRGLLPTDD